MPCPHQPGCTIAEAFHTASALRVWQTFYCESGFQRCERLKLLRAGSLVPADLMPNGTRLEARRPRPAPPGPAAPGEPPHRHPPRR